MRRPAPVLLLLLLLAACTGGHGRAPCPAGQLCLEFGNTLEPATLDPHKATLIPESHVINELLVGLTTFDARGRPVPGAATGWTTSADGLVWTFDLRRGARWSDGVPVTAADFVDGFRRFQAPATAAANAYLLWFVENAQAVNQGRAPPRALGIRALGPHRLAIRLTHPVPYLPQLLANSSAYPVPGHALRRWGDAWVQPGHYLSNGPYTLVSWTLGDRIVLAKNPRYWDAARVCLDRVSFYPTPDAISAERRVKSGELDGMIGVASNRIAWLRRPGQIPAYVRTIPSFADYYLSFNNGRPAFRDRRVRLALSMTVDRAFITGKLLRAGQRPAWGFVPLGMANSRPIAPPVWWNWPWERRRAAAARLLAAAGYGPARPLAFTLGYATSMEPFLGPALQSDWRSIGADVSLAPTEGQVFFRDLDARNFDVAIDQWAMDYNDPVTFLDLLRSTIGAQNHADYRNPAYDRLMDEAAWQTDLRARAELLRRAEAIAMADVPLAPMWTSVDRSLVNPAVTGWIDNQAGWHPKSLLCFRDAARRRALNAG